MKQILPFLFIILSANVSSAQQTESITADVLVKTTTKEVKSPDSSSAVTYLVMSTDKKMKGEYKDLTITVSKNPVEGMLSLEIKSQKNWDVLIELKNADEDVLLFQPMSLKDGDNIIPFETNDASVTSFQLKISEANSNSSGSFLILKKQ